MAHAMLAVLLSRVTAATLRGQRASTGRAASGAAVPAGAIPSTPILGVGVGVAGVAFAFGPALFAGGAHAGQFRLFFAAPLVGAALAGLVPRVLQSVD